MKSKKFKVNGEMNVDENIESELFIVRLMRALKSEGIHYEGSTEPEKTIENDKHE
ncbi:hypothetical protein [Siminovitchia sp. 179-K 8D1 HS]|uniref:hypothetical protein n=1 Tax=Siminovitchia sp. 179-K 8D1 HS TaxID=3142385 RepID=UPI0039A03A77